MRAIQMEPSHSNGKVHVTDEVEAVIRVAEIFKEYGGLVARDARVAA